MTSFKPLVSCIIPVYNAEKYLDQGIKSLLAQTYSNLEIILVDDYSTDKSWDICKAYADKHTNIHIYRNKKNTGGPLRGREQGIKKANGEWITFMDCDDYVTPTYIENLISATKAGKFDIAVTGHSRLYEDGRLEDFIWKDYSQTTEQRLGTFYKHLLAHDFWTDPADTVGQNLIRASICKQTDLSKYSNLVYAEDTLMALAFTANSKNGVNFVDCHDFVWRQVPGSGSNGGFSDRADQNEFYASSLEILHESQRYDVISKYCPSISIIVPVYNVERYLASCLESIVTQTYSNVEIIIVNDGSPDKSQDIVESYANKDKRIRAISQENLGLNMARATGVKAAKGEYITFVDSDDIIHKDHIKILFENIYTNNVDISVGAYSQFESADELSDDEKIAANYSEFILRERDDIIYYYLWAISGPDNVHPMTAWGKLISAPIVKSTDWELSNYRRHEDNLETLQWYSKATRGVSVLSSPTYFYRSNPKSITNKMKHNISPKGELLNYFEFTNTLYTEIINYLQDKKYNLAALNQFTRTTSAQLKSLSEKGQLDAELISSAVVNIEKSQQLYNDEILYRDASLAQTKEEIIHLSNSVSWQFTKPLRTIKRIAKGLKRRIK